VPLPHGAVVGGEIQDQETVADAISQVVKRAKARSRRAYVAIANQRVVVRQIDLPFMPEKEFRASIRYQIADHIPMSVEDAELDYRVIEEYMTEDNQHLMRIQIMAAARDMVEGFVDTVAKAGIEPIGVDLTPFAIARAASAAARGEQGQSGAEAVVDVGAGVTNIIVHHNGEPKFVRILLIGGDDATNGLVSDLEIEFEEAEAVKLDLGRGVGSAEATRTVERRVGALVDEVRGSLDYYRSQEESVDLSSILVSGGGSLTPGFMNKMQESDRAEVRRAEPLAGMTTDRSGLSDEQVDQIEPFMAAAVGIALGTRRR
jgi:type IV pilus assembly protein PilM